MGFRTKPEAQPSQAMRSPSQKHAKIVWCDTDTDSIGIFYFQWERVYIIEGGTASGTLHYETKLRNRITLKFAHTPPADYAR